MYRAKERVSYKQTGKICWVQFSHKYLPTNEGENIGESKSGDGERSGTCDPFIGVDVEGRVPGAVAYLDLLSKYITDIVTLRKGFLSTLV